jgi:CheY-like chemotaxis protein
MHGEIDLDSKLGFGTKTTFRIPFAKIQYQDKDSPLVTLESIPERLQSDLSISCGSTDDLAAPSTPKIYQDSRSNQHARSGSVSDAGVHAFTHSTAVSEQQVLTEAERKNFHVLVVEDNPVNQQIAIKTIKKLNFSVNGVWNGQEALDYLQQAGTPERPMPDIILMDVQMPVLDGYNATRQIRRLSDLAIRNTHIVAMTASAIQGDKEKCQRAGMDDYLAKPVKSKVLEKMLVKWALEGRKKGIPKQHYVASNREQEVAANLHKVSGKLGWMQYERDAALARSSETANESQIRRDQAEEMASTLRDAKLLAVTSTDPRSTSPKPLDQAYLEAALERKGQPTHALTRENIGKLATESGDTSMRPVDTPEGYGSPRYGSQSSVILNFHDSARTRTPSGIRSSQLASQVGGLEDLARTPPVEKLDGKNRPSLKDIGSYDSDMTIVNTAGKNEEHNIDSS